MIPRTGRRGARWLQECGTPAAFRRHWLRGETPCVPCREAHNAERRGDWDTSTCVDEVAVERFLAGEDLPLTRLERVEAARVIVAAGGGASAIARRLHTSGTRARQLYALAMESDTETGSAA